MLFNGHDLHKLEITTLLQPYKIHVFDDTTKDNQANATAAVGYLTLQMSPFLQLLNKSHASMIPFVFSVLCDALRRPVWRTGEWGFVATSQFARSTLRKFAFLLRRPLLHSCWQPQTLGVLWEASSGHVTVYFKRSWRFQRELHKMEDWKLVIRQ